MRSSSLPTLSRSPSGRCRWIPRPAPLLFCLLALGSTTAWATPARLAALQGNLGMVDDADFGLFPSALILEDPSVWLGQEDGVSGGVAWGERSRTALRLGQPNPTLDAESGMGFSDNSPGRLLDITHSEGTKKRSTGFNLHAGVTGRYFDTDGDDDEEDEEDEEDDTSSSSSGDEEGGDGDTDEDGDLTPTMPYGTIQIGGSWGRTVTRGKRRNDVVVLADISWEDPGEGDGFGGSDSITSTNLGILSRWLQADRYVAAGGTIKTVDETALAGGTVMGGPRFKSGPFQGALGIGGAGYMLAGPYINTLVMGWGPMFDLAGELVLVEHLALRVSMQAGLQGKVETEVWEATPYHSGSFGAGYHNERFQVDATISESWLASGPYLLSGVATEEGLFGVLTTRMTF
jgi:hypothetical protein